MQRYRITLNSNVREHRHQFVNAENAEAAIRKAIEVNEWEQPSDEAGNADAEEPTFWAMPVDENGDEVVTWEGIDDEYNHPDGYVYRADLMSFVKMLADAMLDRHGLTDDNTGALLTPESIRRTARHILGMDGTKESAA